MDEVASQSEVIEVLRASLHSENLPHLLFYGPPGTGKTSTILALARDLFGPALFKQRVLELNASDERGIGVVREKIKQFAKVTARETVPGYPCPPFKLIVLDEADSLTTDAQTALRRIIEVNSKGTRFCLICNYVSRIIDPLTSRCAKFRFKPVDQKDGLAKLMQISRAEGVRFEAGQEEATLTKLLGLTGGDLRRAVGLLQSAHQLGRPLAPNQNLDELAGIVPGKVVAEAIALLQDPQADLIDWVQANLIMAGFPAHQFISQLAEELAASPLIGDLRKGVIAIKLAETDLSLTEGADEHIQLLSCMATIHNYIHSTNPILPPSQKQ